MSLSQDYETVITLICSSSLQDEDEDEKLIAMKSIFLVIEEFPKIIDVNSKLFYKLLETIIQRSKEKSEDIKKEAEKLLVRLIEPNIGQIEMIVN